MKDPAFLFYSNDFYEGTRTMLPEERACYIDLLVYQHQHDYIPNDPKRMSMYCSGISEEIVMNTLKEKFKQTSKGWFNEVLQKTMADRSAYAKKQSENGTIGQFWKRAKTILNKQEYSKLKDVLYHVPKDELLKNLLGKEINKAMLIAMLKHLEIINRDVNSNINIDEIETESVIEDEDVVEDGIGIEGIDIGGVGEKEREYKKVFDIFRKQYPGTKRGLETEYSNFKKKHKDYRACVSLLLPALRQLIGWRENKKASGQFVPEYANLSTWINQRRWEAELESVDGVSVSSFNPRIY